MFSFSRCMMALVACFGRDRRANTAVTFALVLLPVLSAIGCAVDYSETVRMRAKLQSAADAASVAAISQMSAGYNAASLMIVDGEVAVAEVDAKAVFNGNISGVGGFNNLALTATVTKTGVNLLSTVNFTADVPTVFMGVVEFQKLKVTGLSRSSASLPPSLDFYFML